ncbi:MAG: hypothetical protein HFJ59_03260 [Clostridia bacterium]|nr:hypothetical protein [Clostridia bacterium]
MNEIGFGFELHTVAIEIARYMMEANVECQQAIEDKCIPEEMNNIMTLLKAQICWYLKNSTLCK